LRTQSEEDAEQQEARFHREGRLSARLDHPNIVRIYDYSEHEGRFYFSMEFLEGGSLKDRIRAGGESTPEEIAELLATLADAVQYAHDQGVVHRDLKPSNVLFTRDGRPKIADFGMAKRLDGNATRLTQSHTIIGTANYMAPEQAAGRGKNATPQTDVYALGAILYEVLTGQPPFNSEDWMEILLQVRTQPPIPPALRRPGVPEALDRLCLRCLEKEPEKRPATAAVLAQELRQIRDRCSASLAAEAPESTSSDTVTLSLSKSAHQIEADRHPASGPALHASIVATLTGHTGTVSAVAISPDGKTLATGGFDDRVRLWGFPDGREGPWLSGHTGDVNAVAFSPDGKVLAAAGDDRTVRFWYVGGIASPLPLQLDHPDRVYSVCFSPDGKRLGRACDDFLVRLWSVSDGPFTMARSRGTRASCGT
jgi:serine/threonine protein kinase